MPYPYEAEALDAIEESVRRYDEGEIGMADFHADVRDALKRAGRVA